MSLLDQASLVLVPSAIKTGEVLVQKPLPTKFSDETGNYDGNDPTTNANLTFTRNSNATRVNSEGLVEKVRTNLLTYSNDFSNAIWNKFGSVPVSYNNATAPDGTLTASTASFTVAGGGQQIWNTYTFTANTYTDSIYLRSATGSPLSFTFGFYDTAGRTKTITVGTTWQRFDHTATLSAIAGRACWLYPNEVNATVEIWHAQMELSDFGPTQYIPTTSAAVSVGPTANVPRLNYSNGCPSLLLEPQRTNTVVYNTSFDNAYFTKSYSSISANVGIAPTGYQEADKIIPDTSTNTHGIYRSSQPITGGVYSVYAKADGYDWILLTSHITSAPEARGAYFNVRTGEVGAKASGMTTWIEDAGNGWFRCSINEGGSPSSIMSVIVTPSNGTFNFAGDGTSGVQIWGLQNEQGAYPTSVILTEGASVTRLADAAYKTGISSLIGQTEGTIFLEFDNRLMTSYPSEYIFRIIGSDSDQIWLRKESGGAYFTARLITNSSTVIWTISSIPVPDGDTKIAISYKTGDSVLYLNGTQFGTSSATFSGTDFSDFHFNFSGTLNPELKLNQALLFKTRLTNAQLAELTAL